MYNKISETEIIQGAKHQINGCFETLQGKTHLALILPMDLLNNQYAMERFTSDVKSIETDDEGQYSFELISNTPEPGVILDSTEKLSFEGYKRAINNIIKSSHKKVKEEFGW
jgi:hypothetical protein